MTTTEPSTTEQYEGLPVRRFSAAVRGASGDALNGALKVAPRTFHPGERAFLLLEVKPDGVNYVPDEDDDLGPGWTRMQVLRVQRGAFVDDETALPILDAVTTALEDKRVEETGQERIFGALPIEIEHLQGQHKRPRKACPHCTGDATDEEVARAEAAIVQLEQERAASAPPADDKPAKRGRRRGAAAE